MWSGLSSRDDRLDWIDNDCGRRLDDEVTPADRAKRGLPEVGVRGDELRRREPLLLLGRMLLREAGSALEDPRMALRLASGERVLVEMEESLGCWTGLRTRPRADAKPFKDVEECDIDIPRAGDENASVPGRRFSSMLAIPPSSSVQSGLVWSMRPNESLCLLLRGDMPTEAAAAADLDRAS